MFWFKVKYMEQTLHCRSQFLVPYLKQLGSREKIEITLIWIKKIALKQSRENFINLNLKSSKQMNWDELLYFIYNAL